MTPAPPSPHRCAVVAGASGLVGRELVRRLLREPRYRGIFALSRKPLATVDPRLEVVAAAFDRLPHVLQGVESAGASIDVFCCLGTTIGVAGSREAFRQVDHDYVLALGRWAQRAGARRMVVVSALGADPDSRVFYNRVKGETERDLAALGLPSLVIARPSLLAGERAEFRPGERLALLATRPLRALIPARIRPIAAEDVAQALVDAALADVPPSIVESAAMQGAAQRARA
jgi:uncharacterized protein YbjT (DUF2867 family)